MTVNYHNVIVQTITVIYICLIKNPDELTGKTARIMAREKEIKFYVSKIETSTKTTLFVDSNFEKDYHGIILPSKIIDQRIIQAIKNYMVCKFERIMEKLNNSEILFDLKFVFNNEYLLEGKAVYFHSEDKKKRYFHEARLGFKSPIEREEIRLFFLMVSQIHLDEQGNDIPPINLLPI